MAFSDSTKCVKPFVCQSEDSGLIQMRRTNKLEGKTQMNREYRLQIIDLALTDIHEYMCNTWNTCWVTKQLQRTPESQSLRSDSIGTDCRVPNDNNANTNGFTINLFKYWLKFNIYDNFYFYFTNRGNALKYCEQRVSKSLMEIFFNKCVSA